MTDAVIVSTARTVLGKSWKGAFNMTYGATLGAHSVRHAVERAGIDPAEVEDVIMGSTFGEGTTGGNIARASAGHLRGNSRRRHEEACQCDWRGSSQEQESLMNVINYGLQRHT